MSLFTYTDIPFYSMTDLQHVFDDFDCAWSSNASRTPGQRQIQGGNGGSRQNQVARSFQPRMNLHESPDANVVTATFELPGLKKEHVNINIQNNSLLVSGEVTTSKKVNENGYVHRECKTGRFLRRVPLPSGTKPEDIKASMQDSVLSVTFPKVSAEQGPKRITIQ